MSSDTPDPTQGRRSQSRTPAFAWSKFGSAIMEDPDFAQTLIGAGHALAAALTDLEPTKGEKETAVQIVVIAWAEGKLAPLGIPKPE